MKAYSLFPLFLLTGLLAACAPPSLEMTATAIPSETPAPTSVFTSTPLPTTTPAPTPTLEPTPQDTPTAKISLSLCPQLVEAEVSSAGALEIVYATGDAYQLAYRSGLGELGFSLADDADHTGLWLWSEDTRAAVPFPLPPDAFGPKLSADHRRIVFRRDTGEKQSELWVIDTQGQHERKLATLSLDDVKARDPSSSAILNYGWVPNTDKVYYWVDPYPYGVGGPSHHDTFVLIDLDSGQAISMAKPGEAQNVVFAPDGRQAAVLTDSELRLVSTQNGGVQFTLPLSLRSFSPEGSRSPAYSPDGKSVIGFTDQGIVRLNAADGQWQIIPLAYTTISIPEDVYFLSPKFTWVDSSTLLLPILDSDLPQVEHRELDPNVTFTVWRVDLAGGTAQPVRTFTGYPPSVVFSPDGQRLAFYQLEGESQPAKSFLADLNTGEILETLESGGFIAWHPDSKRYLYTRGEYPAPQLYLGQMGGAPILLGDVGSVHWVDAERFVINVGCEIRLISAGGKVEVTLDTPTAEISPIPCHQLQEAKIASTGALEVVYTTSDAYLLRLLGLWLWSEDTQAAVPFPLPPDALGPTLSADHRWIVFQRYIGETQRELWVIDAKGQNERKLATVSLDEFKARDPYYSATVNYGWVPSTDKVYYLVDPTGGVGGPPPHDAFVLVSLDSGKAISLAKPGEAYNVVFAPDGRQAAVLTASELRLVSTQNGGVQFTLPLSLRNFGPGVSNSPAYSPDGQYVIGFTDEGIVRLNAADGRWQVIPLKYKPISSGPGDSTDYWSPRITWVDNSTIFLPVTDYEPPGGAFEIDVFDLLAHPDATFTVWRIDLASGTAQPVRTFTGFPPSVVFSPDGKRLAFSKPEGEDQFGKLFLADLNTGDILETIESSEFIAWHPDSRRYLHTLGEYPDVELYLGQIGEVPILLGDTGSGHWVDAERFVINVGCEIRLISAGAPLEATLIP